MNQYADPTSQYGNYASNLGAGLSAVPTPWTQAAGLGLQAVGTGLSAYGAYNQQQNADKQYQLALQAWQAEKARQERMDADERQQQLLTNIASGGNYATNQLDKTGQAYSRYSAGIGA